MFDFVRQHTKIMQILLFLLIFPSFVLFGIDGYNRFLDNGQVVASVDGQKINQAEWDRVHQSEVDRMKASMPNLDAKFFDSPLAKFASLERLVRDRVLQAASTHLHLQVSDQRLAQTLSQNPAIAQLKKADGTLDVERYKSLLAAQGMSPEMFEAQMRQDLAKQQVLLGVSQSEMTGQVVLESALNAYYEKRSVQIVRFMPSDFMANLKPSQDDLMAFYKSHAQNYQSAEQARIEYLVLSMKEVQKSLTLADADLKTYYEQNFAKASAQEERRASHILLTLNKSMSDAEKAQVKAKAQSILEELKKSPNQFAALAQKYSQDPGSAAKGGDLDFFAKGAMVKAFEDAAFAMKKDQISDLVESEFGYHIIKVTDIKAPKVESFESARAEIEKQVRREQAQKKFAEVAESFTNLVYEQADSLEPAASKLKLNIETFDGLNKVPDAKPLAAEWMKNPKFLEAVFSSDVIEKKHNTQAIEVAPNTLVAARIKEYKPAKTLDFEVVKSSVELQWKQERSLALAKEAGKAKLDVWKEHPEQAQMPKEVVVSREKGKEYPVKLIEEVLKTPLKGGPVWNGIDLGQEGFAVVKVLNVEPSQVMSADRSREKAQLGQWLADAESEAYYEHLKSGLNVKITAPNPIQVK
jgi:peptidyl-prolyl cis-trans isomerase D